MLDIDTGMQAFIAGNYAMAVNHLLKAGQFIDASNTTIAALTALAKRAWDDNDYINARLMAKNALLVARGHVTIALLYNAAISDWQYRNTTVASQLHIHDDLTRNF